MRIDNLLKCFLLLCGVLFGAVVSFAEPVAHVSLTDTADPLSSGHIIKTILALLVVCSAAAIIVGRVLPKFLEAKGLRSSEKRELTILERLYLDRDHQLVVVATQCGTKLLFSVGKTGVLLHGTVSDNELQDEGTLESKVKDLSLIKKMVAG